MNTVHSIMSGNSENAYFDSHQAAYAWMRKIQRRLEESTGLYSDGNVTRLESGRYEVTLSAAYQA